MSHQFTVNYEILAGNPNKGAILRRCITEKYGNTWFEVVFKGPTDSEKGRQWRTIVEFDSLEKAREYFES